MGLWGLGVLGFKNSISLKKQDDASGSSLGKGLL